MGAINLNAWGSMNPETDKNNREGMVPHSGTYQQCVDAARAWLDEVEKDLRAKVGDEAYETT